MSFKSNLPKNKPAKAESLKIGSVNNDLKEPSNMCANKEKNNGFSKWLPAIIFTLLLHVVLLVLFILNDNKSSDKVDTKYVNSIDTENINRNINIVEDTELPSTITTTDNHDAKETLLNEPSSNTYKEEEDSVGGQATSINIKKNVFKPSPTNQAILDHVTNQASTLDMESQNVVPINSNNAVLLPRDLPSSKTNINGVDDEYAKKAQQIEMINSKISHAIQAVKQQNIDNIESHKRQLEIAESELKTKDTVGRVVVSQKVKTDNNADEEKTIEPKQSSTNNKSNTLKNTIVNPTEPLSESFSEASKIKDQAKDNNAQELNQINDAK